jgi:hypothetical protein
MEWIAQMRRELEALGDADLEIASFRLWIHGRQFPDSTDYWDGNWLRVTAYCTCPDAVVRVHGSIVRIDEVVGLLHDCERMNETLKGEAALSCMETQIDVTMKARWNGGIDVRITLTPDPIKPGHVFDDATDQSRLSAIIAQCQAVIATYPPRDRT